MAVESKVEESMADEFKPKESKGDDPWRMAWRMAYIVYEIIIEISEKKKQV